MEEFKKPAIAVFNENGELKRVDVFDKPLTAEAIHQAKMVIQGDKFEPEPEVGMQSEKKKDKPEHVTLDVHSPRSKTASSFNKKKPLV